MQSSFFQRYLLPGIVFQSVLIGGAYSTGREIVEYGAQYGPSGLWSVFVIFVGFSVISAIAFDFARVTRSYDYRSFTRQLIGPLWPAFDVLYVSMSVITIAVVGSASGNIVEMVLGLPYWFGVSFVIVTAGVLMMGGRTVIERFKTIGSVVLYGGYLVFAFAVLSRPGSESLGTLVFPGNLHMNATPAVTAGILYVGYNLGVLPTTLFVLDRQEERGQSLAAGVLSGVFSTIPFLLTYLCVLSFYPDPEILGAPVPWLSMLSGSAAPWVMSLYGLVIYWTLIETSTGMTHAILDRISAHLSELGRARLGNAAIGIITVSILSLAALLSRFGIIDLVARGYQALAYGFLVLFAIPLLTVGLYSLWTHRDGIET